MPGSCEDSTLGGSIMGRNDRFIVLEGEGSVLGRGYRQVLMDRETGVQYLFIQCGYAGGLTVLVDADGKPLTGVKQSSGQTED